MKTLEYSIKCPECANIIQPLRGQCDYNIKIGDCARFDGSVRCKCGKVVSFSAYYIPADDCIDIESVEDEE